MTCFRLNHRKCQTEEGELFMPEAKDRPVSPPPTPCETCGMAHYLSRRDVLKSAFAAGLALPLVKIEISAAEEAKKVRPQSGDLFVFSLGERLGQVITLQDLPTGGPPLIAYPLDPLTQTVRDGSRLNQVVLLRLPQEDLTEQTRTVAAEGVVGYSAICPHTGCNVTGWKEDAKQLVCPCHASAFDPKDRARVASGPAPRPLAVLPLKLVDGKVTVAGAFSGRVGAEQK